MTRVLAFAAALLASSVLPASAHQGHASPSPSPAPAASPSSDAAPEAAAAAEEGAAAPVAALAEGETDPPQEELGAMQVIPWQTALTSHLHNKIVHFPLAFGLAAAVLFIVGPRWPAYAPAARLLLVVAALAAVAAYLSGGAQEAAFDDSPFHAVVELHEKFGIASALTLIAGVALTFRPAAQRFMPVYGVLLLLVLSATGFLGGVLSHS